MKSVGENSSTRVAAQGPSLMLRRQMSESGGEEALILGRANNPANADLLTRGPQPINRRLRPSQSVFQPKRDFSTAFCVAKRGVDFVLAVIMLAALSPLMVVIAIVLRTNGSPVIFSHKRVGKSGELFECYKFRTMKADAEHKLTDILRTDPARRSEWLRTHKLENDPRITSFGRFLRKSSLDELPQFINVIRGEMSLVGPRPIVVDELARYGSFADYYLTVKPGLTGLWQISGRNTTTYHRRVALDAAYVRHASMGFDLKILVLSALPILKGHGAG